MAALLGSAAPVAATGPPPDFEPGPERYPAVVEQPDVRISMPDGVTLRADVRRPADARGRVVEQPLPAVLTVTAYNKSLSRHLAFIGPIDDFVKHGYVQVIVDARGTGGSEGEWQALGEDERADGARIAEWITSQPWSNGRLALYGASYMGINQFFTAAARPPGLRAVFSMIAASDLYRDVIWRGGNLHPTFLPAISGVVSAGKLAPPGYAHEEPLDALGLLLSRLTSGWRFSAESAAKGLVGDEELAYDGPFYRQRSPEAYVGEIEVPTFVVGGWFDIFQRGTPRLYERLRMRPGRKRLLMGPWYHVTTGERLGQAGAPPPFHNLALAWFERWLRGERNGIDKVAPVAAYELGSARWRQMKSWPPPKVDHRRLYLGAGPSGAAQSLHDGALSWRPPARAVRIGPEGNAATGVCSRSATQWSAGLLRHEHCERDNRVQERGAITFTSAPLAKPLRIAGPIGLTLRGLSTRQDTTWTATLSDVAPDGTSTQLTAGWLRAAMRTLDRSRTVRSEDGDVVVPWHPFTKRSERPLRPNRPTTFQIEIFGTHAMIKPGHRLRLTIGSGDLPHWLATVPSLARAGGALNWIVVDPKAPSHLTLPVTSGRDALSREEDMQ